jgi:shikimate dehydrogenase
LPIEPANFDRCIGALPLMGFTGVNVTVPHKRAAAALSQQLDEDATATGAVNMLTFGNNGIIGSNTDVHGFLASLRETFPAMKTAGVATVIGAGGAARAVVLALMRAGFSEIRLVNRTREKAVEITSTVAGSADCRVVGWGEWTRAFSDATLVVNTTSLGMTGKPPLELSLEALPAQSAVADIVYNPLETRLLHQAKQTGHQIMDGLGMLMHQAVPAFAAWFGVTPAVTPGLRSDLLKALRRA